MVDFLKLSQMEDLVVSNAGDDEIQVRDSYCPSDCSSESLSIYFHLELMKLRVNFENVLDFGVFFVGFPIDAYLV